MYTDMTLDEIFDWMAYDKTQDDEWLQEYNNEVELEKQNRMHPLELLKLQKQHRQKV